MKRVLRIKAQGYNAVVEVTIRVTSTDALTTGEVSGLVSDLGDSFMRGIAGARHLGVPLSEQKVLR